MDRIASMFLLQGQLIQKKQPFGKKMTEMSM